MIRKNGMAPAELSLIHISNIGVTSGGKYHEAQGALSKLIMDMPVNWFGYPEDIANVCLFLCSEEAKWINGAVISVDGGMSVC